VLDLVVDATSGAEAAVVVARCDLKPPPHKEQPDYKFDHALVKFHKPHQALPNFEPRSFCHVCTPAWRVAASIAGDVLHASPLEL
jgi:hypothetical protein